MLSIRRCEATLILVSFSCRVRTAAWRVARCLAGRPVSRRELGGAGETCACDPASAGPSGARMQEGRIAGLFGRPRTPDRAASAAAGRGWGFRQPLLGGGRRLDL